MVNFSGRCGEHLVCTELLRRGIIATTFSGNMPDFDILTEHNKVQVKTISEGEWSISKADKWLEFDKEMFEKGIQRIVGKKDLAEGSKTIFVFVKLGDKCGEDRFFILRKSQVQDIIHDHYKQRCTESYNGFKIRKRPKNPKTTHTAIHIYELKPYEDNWKEFEA